MTDGARHAYEFDKMSPLIEWIAGAEEVIAAGGKVVVLDPYGDTHTTDIVEKVRNADFGDGQA